MNEADCLIVFAAGFSNHTESLPKIPTIQVDFDPQHWAVFMRFNVRCGGSGRWRRCALWLPAEGLSGKFADRRPEIAERWAIWRAEKASRRTDDAGSGINAAIVFENLGAAVDKDAVLAVDVGNNAYSFGRYFEARDQAVLMSGYLGSIGFSFPAAMGAWAAVGDKRQIVFVSGDGGFWGSTVLN